MVDPFLHDVFLSHHHADKPRVRLAERLKAAGVQREAGLRLWWDERVIQAGDIRALKVDEVLEQSRVLLLCLSPAALERSTAVHRDPANAGRRFIPLLLGDCALLETLRRYKVVDFGEESDVGFAEACETKRRHQPMLDRIRASLHQSRTLATRRDTLLPKLLSGELSVARAL